MSKHGIIYGEPIETYHTCDAVSHSRLEVFRKRPALYKAKYIDKTHARPTTKAFEIGSAVHCAVLEPSQFPNRFAVSVFDDFRKTNAKEWRDSMEASGKTVIGINDIDTVRACAEAVQSNLTASKLLAGGVAEATFRVPMNGMPLPLQCRPDYFNSLGCEITENRPYIVDIKTLDSIDRLDSFGSFAKAFINFGYHRQCGFYVEVLRASGIEVRDFFFIAVEKAAPHGVAIFKVSDEAIQKGSDESAVDLVGLAESYKLNSWPNLSDNVISLDLPTWYN